MISPTFAGMEALLQNPPCPPHEYAGLQLSANCTPASPVNLNEQQSTMTYRCGVRIEHNNNVSMMSGTVEGKFNGLTVGKPRFHPAATIDETAMQCKYQFYGNIVMFM